MQRGDEGYKYASNRLNEIGIPGIKYLDRNSRTAGEGTRNFVVFNPDDVKIVSRNGEKAKALTPKAAALYGMAGAATGSASKAAVGDEKKVSK